MDNNTYKTLLKIDGECDLLCDCGFDDEEWRNWASQRISEEFECSINADDVEDILSEIPETGFKYLTRQEAFYNFVGRIEAKKEIDFDGWFLNELPEICEDMEEITGRTFLHTEDGLNDFIACMDAEMDFIAFIADKIRQNPSAWFKGFLYGSNKKIGTIPSIIFETAINCTSNKLGLCDVCGICYAIANYKQYPGHRNRMIKNAVIIECIIQFPDIYGLFIDYIKNNNIDVIRYNLAGDFRDWRDTEFIYNLADKLPEVRIYGYSKRRDMADLIEQICQKSNIFCGIPEAWADKCPSANVFKPVESLAEWYTAHKSGRDCLGDCLKCRKCYSWKGRRIACLCHGSPSHIQSILDTAENTAFIVDFFKSVLSVDISDRMAGTGLFYVKINEALESAGFGMPYHLTKRGNKSYDLNTVPKLIKWAEFIGGGL